MSGSVPIIRAVSCALALSALLVLGHAVPAAAKMPPFTLESPRRGQAGTRIEVTVTIRQWDNPRTAFEDFPTKHLDGLLGLFPADSVTGEGHLDNAAGSYTPIRLVEAGRGLFTGRVKLPDALGEYAIVAFPDVRDYPLEQAGYPAPRTLTVTPKDNRPRQATRVEDRSWTVTTVALPTMAGVIIVSVAAIAWRRRSVQTSV